MTEYLERVDESILATLGYRTIRRSFADVVKLLTPEQNRLSSSYSLDETAYFFLNNTLIPKLPNITYLPNARTLDNGIMLMTSLGHKHTQKQKGDTRAFQEVYEFFGYGGMLLRNSSGTRFHILKPRDKICTGTDDNMTIVNLNEHPLITQDLSNPKMNSADKLLEERIKTMMLCTFYNGTFKIEINSAYYLEGLLGAAVPRAPIIVGGCKLGQSLYERLSDYKDAFADSGIELVVGGNLIPELQEDFKGPLLTLVTKRNQTLLHSLGF